MPTGATGQLGLALPVQGELSGTWGDTVNNGITQYANIAIAATLTLTNDGAVTLANTTGDATASNIVSTLTGAGTVTAQFAIVRVTGTLTTAKVVTAPSYSKTYTVVNAATGGIVTFKASGQTGVSIAVGESAFVYYNGTDYVKLAGTVNTGVTSFTAGTTGLTPSTATTGAVTLAGTLGTANGGTNLTSFTSGGVVYASSTSALATGSALTFDGSALVSGTSIRANSFMEIRSNTAIMYWENAANTLWWAQKLTGSDFAWDYYNGSTVAEKMRLTSTGLGIGTSSPSSTLDVVGTLTSTGTTASAFFSSGNDVQGGNNPTFTFKVANSNGGFIKWRNAAGTDHWGMYSVMGASGQQGNLRFRDLVAGEDRVNITPAGNVGIGTTSPNAKLSFGNASYASTDIPDIIRLYDTGTASSSFGFGLNGAKESIGQLGIYGGDASTIGFFTGGLLERARINQAGGFSVGTTAASGAGAIFATGNITAYYSDARLKTVSGKIENALDKVAKLSGVYYTNNDTAKSFGYDSDEVQVGVIAQEVEAVLPQIVKAAPFDLDENNNSKSGENYKTVQYDKLVPLLIEAINELQAKVKALESK
jgi:hypothetical protein